MRVIVTGSAGFIGGATAGALTRRGHTVCGVDKREGCSTAHYETFSRRAAQFRPHLILHAGASCSTRISLDRPRQDFEDNAVGTLNVADIARHLGGVPVLYTSTCKVEPGADGLMAPLGLSKQVGERYLQLYSELYALPSVTLQPSTVYGPGQRGDANLGWVSHFVRCAVEGVPPAVHGTGQQSRDVLYIDDMVGLLVDIVEHFADYLGDQRAPVYPVGGGRDNELSVIELLAHLGVGSYQRSPRLPTDLDHVVQDNGAISAVRGWSPAVGWVEGVARTRTALSARGWAS